MNSQQKTTRKSVIQKFTVILVLITYFSAGFSQPPEGILHKRPVNVLVNQVGYQTGSKKTVVLQILDTLQAVTVSDFYILNLTGDTVFKEKFTYQGRINDGTPGDWGALYRTGDFNKYASISCRSVYALTTLAREAKNLGLSDSIRKQVTEEALWGAEFLHKMVLPGRGLIYEEVWNGYSYWGSPEHETDNLTRTTDDRPFRGISPSAMSACALAAAARLTGRNDFRKAAEELWKTAADSLHIDREEIWTTTSGGGQPELENNKLARLIRRTADLLLADLELEALTGNKRFSESAQLHVKALIEYQNTDGSWVSDVYSRTVYQGIPPAALALYARAHPGMNISEKVLNTLRLWIGYIQQITDNPFSLISWDKGVFFNPHILRPDQSQWWFTGQNSQYLSCAWALYITAPLLNEPEAIHLADRQLDWILGINPYGICMMEGKGRFNIPDYHHRWAPGAGRGAAPGAIPNGFCRIHPDQDRPYMDMIKIDYHTTEPWEPHNAFYLLAVSARNQQGK